MYKHPYLPVAAAILLSSGCSHVAVTAYSGVIQRIETGEITGYVVSPIAHTASPLVHPTHVYLSITEPPGCAPQLVRIDFLDVPKPEAIGSAGDRVAFAVRGELPFDGHLPAEALTRYAVAK